MVLSDDQLGSSPIKYTIVTGFFLQDESSTDPSIFDYEYTATNFGLINQTYDTDKDYDPDHEKTQWQRFEHHVSILNQESNSDVQYKLLYMGRHGEAVHNVAENFYGTAAWDDYWSKLDGNDTVTWADAHLTGTGIQQARKANAFWATEMEEQKIPVPENYYTSPLHRCLATANATFSGLRLPASHPFIPEVKELLREVNGVHTCDRRSSKTHIHADFSAYLIEDGFAENDELWSPDIRESDPHMDARLKTLLDDIIAHDGGTYVSFTSHSGAISGLLRVLGHRPFGLSTGSVIPVLVKAETETG